MLQSAHRNRFFIHPKAFSDSSILVPHFLYPTTLVGASIHFTVYSATTLGNDGVDVAKFILANCESAYTKLHDCFGIDVQHFNVIVAPLSPKNDGTGGAFHQSCSSADLYCDVRVNPKKTPEFTQAMVIAEAVEVFEAYQAGGWACGASNGEGLSRVLAEDSYPGVVDDFATAHFWLDSSRDNWVDLTATTDRSNQANGCAVLFLFWLRYALGFSWAQICQAPASTLAGTYSKLTGKTDGYLRFRATIDGMYPPGKASQLTVDNPFNTIQPTGLITNSQAFDKPAETVITSTRSLAE